MTYNLLSEINPISKQWSICVNFPLYCSFCRYDLLSVCSKDVPMHTEIPGEHVEAKRAQLQGNVCALSRVLVCSNKEKYRSIDSTYMVERSLTTLVYKGTA